MENTNLSTQEKPAADSETPSCELASQQQLLQRLEHFSIYSDKLIVLVGASGSGKSSILSLLANSTPAPVRVIRANCQKPDWFAGVLSQYGIHSAAGEKSFHFGLGQIDPVEDFLLILDEAEHLTIEQIERLADKVQGENFHCVLAIDESSHNLAWLSESPEQVLLLQIEPLNDDECSVLLAHELGVEEHQLSVVIGELKVSTLSEDCEGNPGEVISYARSLLSSQSEVVGRKSVSTKSILMSVAYLSLALVLTLALVFQDEINQLFTPAKDPGSIGKVVNSTRQHQAEEPLGSPFKLSDSESNDKEQTDINQKQNIASQSEPEESSLDESHEFQREETHDPTSMNGELAHISEQASAGESDTINVSNSDNKDTSTSDLPPANDSIKTEASEINDMASRDEGALMDTRKSSSEIASPSSLTSTPSPSEKSSTQLTESALIKGSSELPAEKKDLPYTAEEIQLLQMEGSKWMIQLAGFSVLGNAASFMQQHLNAGELHFYRTDREGMDWYVVVMGPYPNKAAAQQKRLSLPPELRTRQPWLKPLSSIHQEIQLPARR